MTAKQATFPAIAAPGGRPARGLKELGAWLGFTILSTAQNVWATASSLFEALTKTTIKGLYVGTATVDLESSPEMVIGGGIDAVTAPEQEGRLRVVALVLKHADGTKIAIVSADVLFVTRDFVDRALAAIERQTGIPADHILVHATHTHHAPSTVTLHGYERDEVFCGRLKDGIVNAVIAANANLSTAPCSFHFHLGQEASFGQNSRLLLSDKSIYWIGPYDDAVGPTGPTDTDLPVLAFRRSRKVYQAVIFNHSTHTIKSRAPGVKSPSVYGLTAQELEQEIGGTFLFLNGASGSTHNLTQNADEAISAVKGALYESLGHLEKEETNGLLSVKKPFTFKVRRFDDAVEDLKVSAYCEKRVPSCAASVTDIFRRQRARLIPQQGETRTIMLQVLVIGPVALVGIPGEYFASLGLEIKRRSPFAHTCIVGLANDWAGYFPDREAHRLGGYQTWMGPHSYAEEGTGERIADEVVAMLKDLAKKAGAF